MPFEIHEFKSKGEAETARQKLAAVYGIEWGGPGKYVVMDDYIVMGFLESEDPSTPCRWLVPVADAAEALRRRAGLLKEAIEGVESGITELQAHIGRK